MVGGDAPDDVSAWGTAGVGCIGAVAGFFGGGMIAVLVGKLVGSVRGCAPANGLPACDHAAYLTVGSLTGLVLVPAVSVWLMRRRGRR